MAQDRTRLAPVDGMRGLAAAMVLLHHIHLAAGSPALIAGLGLTFGYLKTGVNLFFVLSGFCLFYPYTRQGVPFVARTFFRRRIRRILPPYYAAIAVVVLLPFLIEPIAARLGFLVTKPTLPSWTQLWTHLLMLHTFSADTFLGIDGPFWSLAVETQFYLVFPFAAWLVLRFGPRGVGVIALITLAYRLEVHVIAHAHASGATLAGNNSGLVILVNFFLGHWLEFAFGMLVALLVRRRAVRALPLPLELSALAIVLALYLCAQVYITLGPPDRWLPPVADTLLGLSFSLLLLLACVRGSWTGRLFAHRLPVWLGTISYSLYLIHLPILLSLGPTIRAWHLADGATVLLVGLIGVPIVLACAAIFFQVIERPFLTPARPAVDLPAPTPAPSASTLSGATLVQE